MHYVDKGYSDCGFCCIWKAMTIRLAVDPKLEGNSGLLDPCLKIHEHIAYTIAEIDSTTVKALADALCMCMLVGSEWLVGVVMW